MITPAATRVESRPGAPDVWLLDATAAGLDEAGLRSWARQLPEAPAAAHSSRSYRHPYALVACAGDPVGVDLERVEPFDPAFRDSICTPEERAGPVGRDAAGVAALWCSKEALSKALGDALRYDPRRLGSPILWPGGSAGPWRAASLPVPDGYVGWLCWREPGAVAAQRRQSPAPAAARSSSRTVPRIPFTNPGASVPQNSLAV